MYMYVYYTSRSTINYTGYLCLSPSVSSNAAGLPLYTCNLGSYSNRESSRKHHVNIRRRRRTPLAPPRRRPHSHVHVVLHRAVVERDALRRPLRELLVFLLQPLLVCHNGGGPVALLPNKGLSLLLSHLARTTSHLPIRERGFLTILVIVFR